MPLIRTARTAQYLAVRALTVNGLAHPVTRLLLAAAATAAARAWEAGHRVEALHPTHPASCRRLLKETP
ncbi:hypothetical protein [Streptomyces sp. MW-W600-10]|uniref:hypothetical protein n=1 Tax=Streptomyces sp. MW-W600-10 TaxID=2829819 RepID=UPI001C46C21E|nr:hypothetical protein [Streptomyces sp. MW-W600-10]MBV7249242.1 hypothetical protein [Streptomyces sp. MW-W600-10]